MFDVYNKSNIQKNNGNRIMILEDVDIHIEFLIRSIKLDYDNIKIDVVRNEIEAIKLLKQTIQTDQDKNYDFIVADINLEEKGGSKFGGLSFLEYLVKNIDTEVKVIIVTAHSGMIYTESTGQKKSVLNKARELGAYACLSRNAERNYLDSINIIISEPHQTIVNAAREIDRNLWKLEKLNPVSSYNEKIVYLNNQITDQFKHTVIETINKSEKKEIEDFILIEEFILDNNHLEIVRTIIKSWLEFPYIEISETKSKRSTPVTDREANHQTKIVFPSKCILYENISLKIQLIMKDIETQNNTSNKHNSKINKLLDIHITAKNFEINQKCQKLEIPFNQDSNEIVFQLKPCKLEEQIVEIEFYCQGSRVGYAIVKTNVEA